MCEGIVPPYLNHLLWDRVGVIKTPHFAFDPLGFDGDLSSPLMMAWCGGSSFVIFLNLHPKKWVVHSIGPWQLALIHVFFSVLP
jgi:hypothetical protein